MDPLARGETQNEERRDVFRERITDEFISKIANGEAIWQVQEGPVHMPVNPISQKYFQGSNAMIFMQRQHELGTMDPRWVQQNQIEKFNGMIKKGEKATVIETVSQDGKRGFTRYFNLSQMFPKDRSKPFGPIEVYDAKMDKCAKIMLSYGNTFSVEKLAENKDAFFEVARNVSRLSYVMAHENEAVNEAVAGRLEAIQSADLNKKATLPAERFLQACRKALDARPESKGFVVEATKELLLEGVYSKSKIKALITQYAPESARDGSQKNSKYSEYVFARIEKDQNFQKEYKKAQSAVACR